MADESVDIRYLLNSEEFARESSRIDAAIRGTENATTAATAKMESDFQRLGKVVGRIGIATALAAAGREVFNFARDFESHMREVTTISDEVSGDLDAYKDKIIDLTTAIPVAAAESASALYQIVSAGHDGADGMTILEIAARAAVAGVTETATAADGITSILNAYQKGASEAEDISDMMFTTVRLGKTTFGELAASIAQVTPTAAAYGVEMDQVLAAIATLTKSGVPTAQAVTRIRQAIVATSKVLGDGAFDGRSLQEALAEVAAMAGGSESKLRALVPEIEAVNGVLGLTGINAETAAAHLDEMTRAVGATQKAFDRQMEDADKQIERLKNNLLATFYGMGDAALEAVGGLAEVLNEAFATGAMDRMLATVGTLAVAYGTYRTQLLLTAAAKRALENTRYDEESRQLAGLLTQEQQRALGITNLSRLTKEQTAAIREKVAAEMQAAQTAARLAATEKAAATEALRAALQRSLASKEAVRQRQAELVQARACGEASKIEAAEAALAAAQEERHAAAIARKTAANNLSAARTKAAAAATAVSTLQTRLAEATDKAAARSKNLLTVATTRLSRSFKALKVAFMSNPLGAIVTVITTAAAAMSFFGDAADESSGGVSALSDALAKNQAEITRETAKIDELFDALRKAKKGTQEYADAKEAILRGYGSYLTNLGEEARQLKDVEGAYVAIKNAAIESATARAKASFVEDASNRAAGSMGKALDGLRENIRDAFDDDILKQFPDQVNTVMAEITKAMSDSTKSKRDRRVDVGAILEDYGLSFRTVYHGLLADKSYFDDYISALDELSGVKRIADEVFTTTTASSTHTTESVETVSTRVAALRAEIQETKTELQKLRSADSTASEARISQAAARLKTLQDQLETYTGISSKGASEAVKKQQELGQIMTQTEIDIQAQRIAAMRDGKAKRLAEIELEYQQTQAKIAKDKAAAKSKGATDDQLQGYDSLAAAAEQKRLADRIKIEQEYARQTAEEYRQLSDVFLTEEQRKTKAREKTYQEMRNKNLDDLLAGNITGTQYIDLSIRIDDAETKAELDAQVERYQAYLEERTRIEEAFETEVARLRKAKPHGDAEDEVEQRRRIRNAELQELEDRLGITEDSFSAFVDSLVYKSTNEILRLIETAQNELNKLGPNGDPARRAEQQNRLNAAQSALKYRRGANNTQDATTPPSSNSIKKWEELQKVLKGVCGEFDEIGEAIGGTAGEAVELAGEIATCTLSLIDSIMTAATSSAEAVESTSTAATTAIQGVETASVILAVISAALQLATKIAQVFTKDHELSEEAIKSYEAYMDVTDRLIDKQKDLLATMTGVQAVMASKEGIETIEKQIEATRDLGKAYLASRQKNNHSYGYKTEKKLREDKDRIEAAGFDWEQLRGTGRMEGLFDLSPQELARFQKELPGVWAKLDEDTRKYLETIIECGEQMDEFGEATAEALTGFTLDDARNELLDFLDDMEATFDDVAENFQTTMMHAINRVVASGLNDKLKAWYEKMSSYLEDGELSETELVDLQKDYEEIYRDAALKRDAAYAAAGIVPGQGKDAGLSGEIRESITEETASRLEGLFRVTYDKVAELRHLSAEQLQAVRAGFADVKSILEREILIEEHTRRTAENTDPLASKLDAVIDELQSIKKGGGVYAK